MTRKLVGPAFLAGLAAFTLTGCSTLTLEADVSTQVSGDFSYHTIDTNYHGARVGRVAIALDQPLTSSVTYRLGIEHRSLLDTNRDRGEERAFVGLKWRPFTGGGQ